MVDLHSLCDRFHNMLDVMKLCQYETIRSTFTEDDLKSIIYWMDTLKYMADHPEEVCICERKEMSQN